MKYLDEEYETFLLEFVQRVPRPLNIRVLKVQEETGEVAEALVAWLGFKPGVEATPWDIAMELADVAMTAMVAMIDVGYGPSQMLEAQMEKVKKKFFGDAE
jgi:NTP pyrophosphatase (non-canonical NTP hydrolase)